MRQPLSYYCSPSTFLSLIKNKEFWLTALTLSNDKSEGRWVVERWITTYSLRNEDSRRDGRNARLIADMALSNYEPLGVCFSEDDDLLSQWRGYAHDGSGFSVSFDFEAVEELGQDPGVHPFLDFKKISYGGGDSSDNEAITKIVTLIRETFADDAERFVDRKNGYVEANLEFTPEKHESWRRAVSGMFTVKNGAFREEREWRLYSVQSINEHRGLDFRVSGNAISPYVKVPFPAHAIERVTLGPTNRTPVRVVEALLRANGFKAIVSRSSASYTQR